MNVQKGAVLKGYGDIKVGELAIQNGATFALGNSTTTFKIDGNLWLDKGSTYSVEFSQLDKNEANEEQTNDKTIVTGKVAIDKDSNLVLNNTSSKYYIPETFKLIEANEMNNFEYNPENITFNDSDAIGLREGYGSRISTFVYVDDNKNLVLEVKRKTSEYSTATEFKRNHNEREVAKVIDKLSTGYSGDIINRLDAMEKLFYYEKTYNPKALKSIFNEIGGVIHANSTLLTFTNAKIEHVYDKIDIKSSMSPNKRNTRFHDKMRGQYYYNSYNVDKNSNSPKFDTNVNGFLVGLDLISENDFTVGAMAGYGASELKQEKDKTTMNDINLGLYGGYETDNWIFKGMLLGGYEKYKTDRNIKSINKIANSDYRGFNTALDVEAGYKVALNNLTSIHKLMLTPYLGITGNYVSNEGFKEKGADSLNLKVKDYSNVSAQARLGLGIKGKIKKFGWYARAGIKQLLTNDYNEIESSLLNQNMKIRSAELGKFSYGGGFGADYALSDAWTLFANGLTKDVDRLIEIVSDLENIVNDMDEKAKTKSQNKEKKLQVSQDKEKELQDKNQKHEPKVSAVSGQPNNESKVSTTEQAQKTERTSYTNMKLEKVKIVIEGYRQSQEDNK